MMTRHVSWAVADAKETVPDIFPRKRLKLYWLNGERGV
jgi:hypothetical protein